MSRRVSEFVGVALFAAALIWIIALASYEPSDPAWFASTGAHAAPANFAGRARVPRRAVVPAVQYASYLGLRRWDHRLELLPVERSTPPAQVIGAGMLFACLSAFLGLVWHFRSRR